MFNKVSELSSSTGVVEHPHAPILEKSCLRICIKSKPYFNEYEAEGIQLFVIW